MGSNLLAITVSALFGGYRTMLTPAKTTSDFKIPLLFGQMCTRDLRIAQHLEVKLTLIFSNSLLFDRLHADICENVVRGLCGPNAHQISKLLWKLDKCDTRTFAKKACERGQM